MDDSARKLISGSTIVFIGFAIGGLFSYLFRIVLAHHLPVYQIGLYFSIISFIIFLTLFQKTGTELALVRFLSMWDHEKKYYHIRSALTSLIIFQTIFGLIFILAVWFFSHWLAINYFKDFSAASYLITASILFLLLILEDIPRRIFQGFNNMKWFASLEAIKAAALILFTLIGFSIYQTVWVPLVAFLLATLLVGIIGLIIIKKSYPKINKQNSPKLAEHPSSTSIFKEVYMYGLPLIFFVIGNKAIETLDLLMLTYFSTLDQVGIYSVVLPTAAIGLFIYRPISVAIMPITTKLWIQNEKEKLLNLMNIIYKYLIIIMIPIVTLFILFSQEILYYLFGPAYLPGTLPLQIILCGILFYGLANINISMLTSMNHSKNAGMFMIYATIINAILNFILIPLFGMLGAAISTTIAYLATFVMSYLSIKKINLSTKATVPLPILQLTILFILTAIPLFWFLSEQNTALLPKCIFASVLITIYIVMLAILRLFTLTELKSIIASLRNQ